MSEPTYGAQNESQPLAGEFGGGYAAGRGESMPDSLEMDSAKWNESTPHGFRAASVLNQIKPSQAGLGMSDSAYQRVLPGMSGTRLPAQNGVSSETNDQQTQLRMAGDLPLE